MVVFLSWSGNRSKALAGAFDVWIQSVVQAIKPFYSPEDIDKGSFWFTEINTVLQETRTGILFITSENKERPWVLFEAGALATKIGKTRVIPLLFEMQPTDLAGPLANLNAATFTKEEVWKVVRTLNAQLAPEATLEEKVLNGIFEKWWPDLENAVKKVLTESNDGVAPSRKVEDVLDELLEISRSTRQQVFQMSEGAKYSQELLFEPPRPSKFRPLRRSGFDLREYPDDTVKRVFQQLSPDHRRAISLIYLDGFSVVDAAERLKLDPAEFELRLSEARHLFEVLADDIRRG